MSSSTTSSGRAQVSRHRFGEHAAASRDAILSWCGRRDKDAQVRDRVGALIVRAIRAITRFHLRMSPDRPAYRPNSIFQIERSLLASLLSRTALAPVEHCIHFRCIRFVVHHAAGFHPRVSLEGHLLRTDDHLRWHTVLFQETGCGCGALQAERFLPIPDAGHIDRIVDAFDGTGVRARTG